MGAMRGLYGHFSQGLAYFHITPSLEDGDRPLRSRLRWVSRHKNWSTILAAVRRVSKQTCKLHDTYGKLVFQRSISLLPPQTPQTSRMVSTQPIFLVQLHNPTSPSGEIVETKTMPLHLHAVDTSTTARQPDIAGTSSRRRPSAGAGKAVFLLSVGGQSRQSPRQRAWRTGVFRRRLLARVGKERRYNCSMLGL